MKNFFKSEGFFFTLTITICVCLVVGLAYTVDSCSKKQVPELWEATIIDKYSDTDGGLLVGAHTEYHIVVRYTKLKEANKYAPSSHHRIGETVTRTQEVSGSTYRTIKIGTKYNINNHMCLLSIY